MNQEKQSSAAPETILARLEGRSEVRHQKDQIVYSQGEPADSLFYIETGKVKVTVVSEAGKEAVIAVLLPGSFCGEECLSGHAVRKATAVTLTECTLVKLTKASVGRALHQDREFSELFTVFLMERNLRIQEDLVDQLLNSTEKRLARLLLILANCGKEDQPVPIVPRINQETLAEMIGTSRNPRQFLHEQVPPARLHRVQQRRH